MGYQIDLVERIDLSEVKRGNSIQFTGTVNGRLVTLGVDIFRKTNDYLYAVGFAADQTDNGQVAVDLNLSKRFFRLPLQGVIEPGEVIIDTITASHNKDGAIEMLPDQAWTPLHIGCVALELLHLVSK